MNDAPSDDSASADAPPGDDSRTLSFRSRVEAPVRTLFRWHGERGAFERLIPPWESVTLQKHEGIRDGQEAVMRVGLGGPFSKKWVAEHEDYKENRRFRDVQRKGPFKSWRHTHHFKEDGAEASFLDDEIEYDLPFGGLGRMFGERIKKRIKRQFAYRHRVTRDDVTAHHRYGRNRTLRVAISGSTGLIGSALVPYLRAGGHEVIRMVRSESDKKKYDEAILWDYDRGRIEADKLEGLDAVIHLAGENVVAFKWSEAKKMEMFQSRVRGTEFVSETLADLDDPPDAFLSASAVGIYGDQGEKRLSEDDELGEGGFLTAVCREWEQATRPAAEAGIRTVPLRIGVVLARAGGALPLMLLPFQLGLGGRVGKAEQYVPWIALDDVLKGAYHVLATPEIDGPVNLSAPEPVTSDTFAQTLAGVLNRPSFLNLPAPLARLLLGDAAEEFVLKSARVVPKKLKNTGYRFLYSNLEKALRHQLGRTTETRLRKKEEERVPA
jgi:uncharacterized protein (TIGR01777 family)